MPEMPKEVKARVDAARNELATGEMARDRAEYALRRIPPKHWSEPEVMSVVGRLELVVGKSNEGINHIAKAYHLKPDDPHIVGDMAKVHWALRHYQEAIKVLQTYCTAHPKDSFVVSLLLFYLNAMGYSDDAAKWNQVLTESEGDTARTRAYKALRTLEVRDYEASIGWYKGAIELAPGNWPLGFGLFAAMLYAGKSPEEVKRETEAFCEVALRGRREISAPPRPLSGRLRVAYTGAVFHRHVVSNFMQGILATHNRTRVMVHVYSETSPGDEITARMRPTVEIWRDIKGKSDGEVLELLRSDQIDVLVDLAGHTDSSLIPFFAYRSVAVQASFLGYPATTGVRQMDYKITDGIADPEGAEAYYTEKVYRLPRCAWAYSLFPEDMRHDAYLEQIPTPQGKLSLGGMNLLTKINTETARLWGRAMSQIDPEIKLHLVDRRAIRNDEAAMARLARDFAAGGLKDPLSRIVIFPAVMPQHEIFARYRAVDLNLDPLPYNGTTTTCESMWFGVPTLTLPGVSHVSRVGSSLLKAAGLDEFIARDEDDFVEKIVRFAQDPTPLRAMRPTLRERLLKSPLGDFAGLSAALEDAYYAMHAEKMAAYEASKNAAART